MQGLPKLGDVLDDTYRIESVLGQGNFGAVYLARQISMDRLVAIKVLVAHAMHVDEMIERFRREVLAVRSLSHPNTMRIYDFRGEHDDGMLFTGEGTGPQSDLYALGLIAIEMLTGKSLFEGTGRWEVLHKQISDDPVVDQTVTARDIQGRLLTVALVKIPKEHPKETTRVASTDTSNRSTDHRLDSSAKPKDKAAKKTPMTPNDHSSDWVDIKMTDKPEVPLF